MKLHRLHQQTAALELRLLAQQQRLLVLTGQRLRGSGCWWLVGAGLAIGLLSHYWPGVRRASRFVVRAFGLLSRLHVHNQQDLDPSMADAAGLAPPSTPVS